MCDYPKPTNNILKFVLSMQGVLSGSNKIKILNNQKNLPTKTSQPRLEVISNNIHHQIISEDINNQQQLFVD